MAYKPSLQEIAEDLPVATEGPIGTKDQLLLVALILRQFTDRDHGLTADEIRQIIGLKTGKTPTAAKVRDDIHALARTRALGMDVAIPTRGKNDGFRCKRTFLSSEQARLAINMVRTCKFVTQEQQNEICDSLYDMVSYYQEDSIAGSVVMDERERSEATDVFAAAEAFSKALRKDRKVRFRYAARGTDGNDHYSINLIDDSEWFEETPIALIFSFGYYYAETWLGDDDGRKLTRRLDRVRDAIVSDAAASTCSCIDSLRSDVQDRISETFDMFGDVETRDLILRVEEHMARYVYDRFGHGVKFAHTADDDCGYVHVRIKPSRTFYRWLFGKGKSITLAKPDPLRLLDPLRSIEPGLTKSYEDLLADYEFALNGLHELMEESAAAYGWSVVGSDS